VACSICREKGHDKRQCPIKKKDDNLKVQLTRDRFNILVGSSIFNTLGTAITYALLSQQLQSQGHVANAVGDTLDALILSGGVVNANPTLVIGSMMSYLIGQGIDITVIVEQFERTFDVLSEDPEVRAQQQGYQYN